MPTKLKSMSRLIEIIDLGIHPFADTFIKKDQLNKSEPTYPLKCYLNKSNYLISNSIITDEEMRYNLYEYSYTSSNSPVSRSYWKQYAKKIIKDFDINLTTKILEIGSNDGYLLNQFKRKTKNILGIDASTHMVNLANKKKIQTVKYIFDTKSSKKIIKKFGKFDYIIANNVVNHSNQPQDFIKAVSRILSKKGIFIFESPYWYNLVNMKKFDQIYHEHVSYFTAKSSYNLLRKSNLEIFKIEETPYHGGSLRVYSRYSNNVKKNKVVNSFIKKEEKIRLFDQKTYKKFMKILNQKKLKFLKKIINIKSKGFKIVGVGAAAKANTFLNFIGLNNQIIDYITDSSIHKIGKYTPLTRIPIFSDQKIKKEKKIYAISLAWNLSYMLEKKLKKINKKLKFIHF